MTTHAATAVDLNLPMARVNFDFVICPVMWHFCGTLQTADVAQTVQSVIHEKEFVTYEGDGTIYNSVS